MSRRQSSVGLGLMGLAVPLVENEIVDPNEEKKEEEMSSFLEIMRENSAYENCCFVVGTVGAVVNGATMPVFAVLFSEVLTVSWITCRHNQIT